MPSVKVAKTTEVPAGQGLVVQAGTKVLALFNVEGSYHAIDNSCPHRGGPKAISRAGSSPARGTRGAGTSPPGPTPTTPR